MGAQHFYINIKTDGHVQIVIEFQFQMKNVVHLIS